MRRRRVSHGEGEEEPANEERWMASYMDMVTVLLCTFIVMFSMSTVDKHKFDELKNSLATGFGQVASQKIDTAKGEIVPADEAKPDPTAGDLKLAQAEVHDLTALRDRLHDALVAHGVDDSVSFRIDSRGLTVGLIGSETFFATNSIGLTDQADAVLDAIGPILATAGYQVSVEGHADQRKAAAPFATNWELAAGRSTAVLRRLVETNGFPGGSISAVSFGDTHPVDATTGDVLAENRRVDIVVLSAQPQNVRDLLTKALGEQDAAQSPAPAAGSGADRAGG
jgi:chemotaxis protein MotB